MLTWLLLRPVSILRALAEVGWFRRQSLSDRTGWNMLPRAAQAYVAVVTVAGLVLVIRFFPSSYPRLSLFTALVVFSCVTSLWKVTLPLALSSGSTLSVSYAADLMALILLGPHHAMIVAVIGAWTQCSFRSKEPYPWYRTVFSMAAEAITVQLTGVAYGLLAGTQAIVPIAMLPKAVVGAIATYFAVNTGLVAVAIALSTRRRPLNVWHENFLWSAPSFMVAGAAGAAAALVIDRGNPWLATLMLAPVYLSYRSYHVFVGRIEDQRRHVEETEQLHGETIEALLQTRRAEQALAEEKERLAVTLRSIGDGVIATDLDGVVLLINQAAETLTGWTVAEALGQRLDSVFRNVDPETRQPCDNLVGLLARSGRAGVHRSCLLVARDSSQCWIEETVAPLRAADGRTIGMVVVFRDITDALNVQEERAKAGKIASLGLLAGGIAQDFNTILMAIIGNLGRARVLASDASTRRAIDDAERACLRARQLTWQLLTFSRGGVPHKRTLAVSRLLKESASLTVRGSNVICDFDLAPDLWEISADEEQLVQVISNLVINAQQSMPHGGSIDVHAENVVEAGDRWENALHVQPGRYLRISVTDHGVGIPEQHLGRIFDPYFSTKEKASGLGLATAYSIIKNHGGYVSVSSKLGHGTTLTVNLPATKEGAEIAPDPRVSDSVRGLALQEFEAMSTMIEPPGWRVH
jgi:PAS domain S-box-containing protein